MPSQIKLKQLQRDVIHCRQDATPHVSWANVVIKRYLDNLYVMAPLLPHDASTIIPWDEQQPLQLPNNLGILQPEDWAYLGDKVTIRFRQKGETCRPLGRQGHHSLKKLLQEWCVPPWLRDRIPLIYSNEQLVAVVGYCRYE